MAQNDDILFKPNIPRPEREHETGRSVAEEREAYTKAVSQENERLEGLNREPYTPSYSPKYEYYAERAARARALAETLRNDAIMIIDTAAVTLNTYLGKAPHHLLDCYKRLTGTHFTDQRGNKLPISDPVYNPDPETVRCIFRAAGLYDPDRAQASLKDAVDDYNSEEFGDKVSEKIESYSMVSIAMFGMKLLWTTIKMAWVVMVHATVGFICAYFKGKIKVLGVSIGSMISKKVFKPVEKLLLRIVGYRCNEEGEPMPDCTSPDWEKIDFKKVTCCTKAPIFFIENSNGTVDYAMGQCFENWYQQEMDPHGQGARTICSPVNRDDDTIEPTEMEIAMAQQVVDYWLSNNENLTDSAIDPSDVRVMSSVISKTNGVDDIANSVDSSLNTGKKYIYTGKRTAPWDCFGYSEQTDEEAGQTSSYQSSQKMYTDAPTLFGGSDLPFVEQGMYLFELVEMMDTAMEDLLKFADKAVSKAAALSLWGSSRMFCCWVYLIVMIGTLWDSLINKGSICPNLDTASAMRNEFMYALRLQQSGSVQALVQLLKVLKQIVDMFIRRQKRAAFMAGLKLPLHDAMEQIKLLIMNNLSQFLDILFGPLDLILANMRGIPEVDHMIKNDCFGFGGFMDFLLCLLGNLKASILLEINKLINFNMNDLVIINDIYLSRMRLKSLEAFSKLLGSILNLIAGLNDCYKPEDLVNKIIQKQMEQQYQETEDLVAQVGPETAKKLAAASVRKVEIDGEIPDTAFTPQEVADTDAEGELSSTFNGFADDELLQMFNMEKGYNVNVGAEMVSTFIKDDGSQMTLAEFVSRLEELSGISREEVIETMGDSVFDILRGEVNESTV